MKQQKDNLEDDFMEIIRQNETTIYKICSFYVTPTIPIDDLYQESVLSLWKGFPKFRHESSFTTWIWRVTLNSCLSVIRTEKKHKQNISLSQVHAASIATENMQQEIKQLYDIINKLNPFDRALILLWLDEKSYKEIAEVTGISVANVATKLKRIKIQLNTFANQ